MSLSLSLCPSLPQINKLKRNSPSLFQAATPLSFQKGDPGMDFGLLLRAVPAAGLSVPAWQACLTSLPGVIMRIK